MLVTRFFLLSSDEVMEGLKKFLRDKRVSLSGERLERFVEPDPIAVLELLNDSLMERLNAGSNVVSDDKEMLRSRVDHILGWSWRNKWLVVWARGLWGCGCLCGRWTCLKNVAFQLDGESGRLSSAGRELVFVSDAGQSTAKISWSDGTDYRTSELETIAWSRVGNVSETRVYEAGELGPPFFFQFNSAEWTEFEFIIRAILQELFSTSVLLTILRHNWTHFSITLGWVQIRWFNLPGRVVWRFHWPPLE